MNKIRIFCLAFFSIMSMAVLPAPVQAAPLSQVISLEGDYVILPESDVKLIDLAGGKIYAVVLNDDDNYILLWSDSGGATWNRASQGLPEEDEFLHLEADNSAVVLTTEDKVYRSLDGGQTFECIGGPTGLLDRGEEITSVAVNALAQVVVGVQNPSSGDFPLDGVYIYGRCDGQWEAQGMRQSPLCGVDADVTSVTFSPSGESVIVVATRVDGTYLSVGCPQQTGNLWAGAKWDDGVEVSQISGQSPKEGEMINSEITWMKDSSWSPKDVGPKTQFDSYTIQVAYNSSQEDQSDVYQIGLSSDLSPSKVSRISLPKNPKIQSVDSLASNKNTTVVACTTEEGKILVYYRNSVTVVWKQKFLDNDQAEDPRVAIAPDDTVFLGTSGDGSSFARSEGENLLQSVSLIDTEYNSIDKIVISPRFLETGYAYMTFGDRTLFRLEFDKDYNLAEIKRVFYAPEDLDEMEVVGAGSVKEDLLVYQAGDGSKKTWWGQDGIHWIAKEKEVAIESAASSGDKVWIAGEDGMIYLSRSSGVTEKVISSGMNWVGRVKPGPGGTVLAGGGPDEDYWETIAVIDGNSHELLPFFPKQAVMEDSSDGFRFCYSPADNAIYCVAESDDLYRFVIGTSKWEKVAYLSSSEELFATPRGLYNFSGSEVLFSAFPITDKSEWVGIAELEGYWRGCQVVGLKNGEDLIMVWDGSEIHILRYFAQAKAETKPVVTPAVTEPPVNTQVAKPTTTVSQPVAAPNSSIPNITWGSIVVVLLVVMAIALILALIAKRIIEALKRPVETTG